jgi:putative acetyltransferase
MPSITIRPYRPEDLSSLIALFRASVWNVARSDYTESQIRAWAPEFIDAEQFAYRRTAKPTWVAKSERHIAGFSDVEPDGRIDMLYVNPDFQRRGVAHCLLAHIENAARGRCLDRLYTEASITARPTFQAQGFHVVAAQTVTVRGESMTNSRMEKRLATEASPSAIP